MNTLTKSFAKRALSILLVAIMLFSLGIVGITSTSAVNADLVDIGYDPNGNIYCLNSFSQGTDKSQWTDADNVKMTKTGANTLKITFDNVPTSDDFKFIIHTPNEGHYLQGVTVATPKMNSNCKLTPSSTNNISSATPFTVSFVNVKNTYSSVNMEIYFYTNNNNNIEVKIVSGSTSGGNTGGDDTQKSYFEVGSTVYLHTGSSSLWEKDSPDFWAHFYNSSTNAIADVKMSNIQGEAFVKSVTVPEGEWDKVIFLRVAKNTTAGNIWNSPYLYNQTANLSYTEGKNMYKITGWSAGEWGTYTPSFSLVVKAEIQGNNTVFAGTNITVLATSNADDKGTVTYTLYKGIEVVGTSDDGILIINTANLEAGTYNYTVKGAITLQNVRYEESDEIEFTVERFDGFTISPINPPSSVQMGETIDIVINADTDYDVLYTLVDEDGVTLPSTNGKFSIKTTADDKDTTKTFTISATVTVNNQTYTSNEVVISVDVTPISEYTTINVYFKSSSSLRYVPEVKTLKGIYTTVNNVDMEKYEFIGFNETRTADYWWYKTSYQVSTINPEVYLVIWNEYSLEAEITFTVKEGVKDYYFGVDNLYYEASRKLTELTYEDKDIRNFYVNAAHMLYDDAIDGRKTLEMVASGYVLIKNGDVNCDGKINVRDATLLQKKLANISELSEVGTKVADANSDGNITIKDATAIQKAVAGL